MARIPQPRELAELKGATRHDPQRYETEAPKNKNPLGGPPSHLSDMAIDVWHELEMVALPSVLTQSDRVIFEIVANLLAEYRFSPQEFPTGKYAHLIGGLARLGMTPADRQKLGVASGKEEDDEFAAFN